MIRALRSCLTLRCRTICKNVSSRAKVFFPLIAGQFQRDHRDRETQSLGQTAGVVLNQFGGAGRADDDRLRVEPGQSPGCGSFEQGGGVGAKVTRLEGGLGDGGPMVGRSIMVNSRPA